ncbi:MAG: hypothetical protein WCL18_10360 [bacterium]
MTNKKQLIEEIYGKISAKESYGIFGKVSLSIHPENFKEELPNAIRIKKEVFNPAEDQKYRFFLHVTFESTNPNIGKAVRFHFCGSQCWISTWFRVTSEERIIDHPFVISWFRFLERNGYNTDNCGLNGSCNYEFLPIEEGITFLKKWIDWAVFYGD